MSWLIAITLLSFGVLAAGSTLNALGLDIDVTGIGGSPPPSGHRRQLRRPRAHPAPAPLQAVLEISPQARLVPIPRSFLGFSTEYWTLPVDERHIVLYRRVIGLVHVPGDGRFVLRIGGDSSDHAFWAPKVRAMPRWAYRVTPEWIQRTARVVRDSGLQVIIDLNLITGTPSLAAAWAHHAERELPAHSIIGFEVGNEPDLYERTIWTSELGGTRLAVQALPAAITPVSYALAYQAYEHALARAAPGVPLLAPALALPHRDRTWIRTLLRSPHPHLGTISVHMYPYDACVARRAGNYPTINRVLSPHAVTGMGEAVGSAVTMARRDGLPVRVTEFNSVTCGGTPGVSNTFATALWAPDALLELVRSGATAADLHVRVFSINAPFRFTADGIRARPLLYGLITFARMLGPDSRLVAVKLDAPPSADLSAWAVRRAPGTLNVLLIDKGRRSVRVRLRLPSSQTATVQRLLAAKASSTSGETLAGQHLNADAHFAGRFDAQRIAPTDGAYTVVVRRYSAALVTVPVAATTLAGGAR
ncbi:MAG: hypothetical protein WAK93_04830 [Solirubrobacteraceae bacterium]